jgi:H+/Na+-translocating ferredoxin:NAD+ oxidoreductase subunit B
LLQRPELPPEPACGPAPANQVAQIDAQACIGCARCLPVCPVDAILGAARFLHTVISADCTGCELCLPSCPVDCIVMQPRAALEAAPSASDNRQRYAGHRARDAQERSGHAGLLAERKRAARAPSCE